MPTGANPPCGCAVIPVSYAAIRTLLAPGICLFLATVSPMRPQRGFSITSGHGYLPPEAFCQAVLRCPPPDTPKFFAALQANGWSSSSACMEEVLTDVWELPSWPFKQALVSRGRAFAAGVELVFRLTGKYPDTLADIKMATAGATWTYTRDEETYVVRGEWLVGEERLIFDSRTDSGLAKR